MPALPVSITHAIERARKMCSLSAHHDALVELNNARLHNAHPALFIEMASILSTLGNTTGAQETLKSGLNDFPNDTALIIAYANHCYQANQTAAGILVTTPIVQNTNCDIDILLTHAHLLKASGEAHKAIEFYQSILARDANNVIALSSLGGIELDARNYEKATDYFTAALRIQPSNSHIQTQIAYTYFRKGDMHQGWKYYAARFGNTQSGGIVKPRNFPAPAWDGKPMTNGKLLIWGEQAAGEEILYASMLNDAQKLACCEVIIECEARLIPLFQRSFPTFTSIERSDPPANILLDKSITAQCAAGNLGAFTRNQFSDFPRQNSYLIPDAKKVSELKQRYQQMKTAHGKTGRIIGVSWKSKPLRQGDPKSTQIADWAIIFENSPHLFINLQYGDIEDDFKFAKQKNWSLFDDTHINQRTSLDDFAAQISALDAVITVSNTTAHMAGACGIETYVLLAKSAGLMWHWFDKMGLDEVGLDKVANTTFNLETQSPWYAHATLLRQSVDTKWDDVLLRAKQAIG